MLDIFDQLRDLRLTPNGQYLLGTIPRSVLFKANRDFEKIQRYIPCYKVNALYAIALRFCELQKTYPDWALAGNFDINKSISLNEEKFSMRLVLKIEGHLEKNNKDLRGLKEKLLHMQPDGNVLDPLQTFKDSLKTPNLNLKGLKYLSKCFTRPDVVHEINLYIQRAEEAITANIKAEARGDLKNQQNISCINIESVL